MQPLLKDGLGEQLTKEKMTVSYDVYDIIVKQLVDMSIGGEIDIAPDYQRHFVWDETRESELIESILLGIPVPSLYMATNKDSTWEVVDGVQRLCTIIHFMYPDNAARIVKKKGPLRISGLRKLSAMNGLLYSELPSAIQLNFRTRPIRVTTLNDKSDNAVRYDLFERLNTGGIRLHPQEIRNCVYRGHLTDKIKNLSTDKDFRSIVKFPNNKQQEAAYEDATLRFFAFSEKYMNFDHDVNDFLNDYMKSNLNSDKRFIEKQFNQAVSFIKHEMPEGIVRTSRPNTTPINLYEGVIVGVNLALCGVAPVKSGRLKSIVNSDELKKFTTGGTNSQLMVRGRIHFVRDKLTA